LSNGELVGINILERIGGEEALRDILLRFYEKACADEHIGRFFLRLEPEHFSGKVLGVFLEIMTNPGNKPAADLGAAHFHSVHLGLGHKHFDTFITLFREALEEKNVAPDIIDQTLQIMEGQRGGVLQGLKHKHQ